MEVEGGGMGGEAGRASGAKEGMAEGEVPEANGVIFKGMPITKGQCQVIRPMGRDTNSIGRPHHVLRNFSRLSGLLLMHTWGSEQCGMLGIHVFRLAHLRPCSLFSVSCQQAGVRLFTLGHQFHPNHSEPP